jgi:two-component system chemotaxis response regulator CheY
MGAGYKILIVDDLLAARKILVKQLHSLGFEDITEASDGEQALAACGSQVFHLVISDWNMPRVDGLDLCRKLRELPSAAKTRFLFVTSASEREDVIAAAEAGVRGYLCKPFGKELLGSKIKEVMS